ncbi:MAG: hypothetical protein V3V09_01885 [Arenicellales bacterium]
MKNSVTFRTLRTSLITVSALLASACNFSQTPFIDTCKSMVAYIANEQNPDWQQAIKTQDNDIMRVNLVFHSASQSNQLATCYYEKENIDSEEQAFDDQFRGSPSVVEINGQRANDESLIKASIEVVKGLSKQNYDALNDSVRNASNGTMDKARKAALDAAIEVQRRLE